MTVRIYSANASVVPVSSRIVSANAILSLENADSKVYVKRNGVATLSSSVRTKKNGVAIPSKFYISPKENLPEVTSAMMASFNPKTWDWDKNTGPRIPLYKLQLSKGDLFLNSSVRSLDGYYIFNGFLKSNNTLNVSTPGIAKNIFVDGGGIGIPANFKEFIEVYYFKNKVNAANTSPQDGVQNRGPIKMWFSDLTSVNDGLTNRTNCDGITDVQYSRIWGQGYNSHPTLHEDGLQWVAGGSPGDVGHSNIGSKTNRSIFRRNKFGGYINANVLIQSMGKSTGIAAGETSYPPSDILIEENYFSKWTISGNFNRHIYVIPGDRTAKKDANGANVLDSYGVPLAAYGGDRRPWYITIRGNIFEGKGQVPTNALLHSMTADTGTDYAVVVQTEAIRDELVQRQINNPAMISRRVAAGMPWYSADARSFIVWDSTNVWSEDGTHASCGKWGGNYYTVAQDIAAA